MKLLSDRIKNLSLRHVHHLHRSIVPIAPLPQFDLLARITPITWRNAPSAFSTHVTLVTLVAELALMRETALAHGVSLIRRVQAIQIHISLFHIELIFELPYSLDLQQVYLEQLKHCGSLVGVFIQHPLHQHLQALGKLFEP